jgi:hypothetical protein
MKVDLISSYTIGKKKSGKFFISTKCDRKKINGIHIKIHLYEYSNPEKKYRIYIEYSIHRKETVYIRPIISMYNSNNYANAVNAYNYLNSIRLRIVKVCLNLDEKSIHLNEEQIYKKLEEFGNTLVFL